MNIFRAILAGGIVWMMIFGLYTVMSFIPALKASETGQYFVVYGFLVAFVYWGAAFYFSKGGQTNGLLLAGVMITTALVLDAVITLPLVILPAGGSYRGFFLDPMFLLIVAEYALIVFIYWKLKVVPTVIQ